MKKHYIKTKTFFINYFLNKYLKCILQKNQIHLINCKLMNSSNKYFTIYIYIYSKNSFLVLNKSYLKKKILNLLQKNIFIKLQIIPINILNKNYKITINKKKKKRLFLLRQSFFFKLFFYFFYLKKINLIVHTISLLLLKNKNHRKILIFLKKIFLKIIKNKKNIQGLSLLFKGRINGANRHKKFKFNIGRLFFQTFFIKKYTSNLKIITSAGSCNLKITVCFKKKCHRL